MIFKIDESWLDELKGELEKEYFRDLQSAVIREYENFVCYPPQSQIFAAINFVPLSKIKVVIIGQDPYHGKGQANGLSFSVNDSVKFPPSLVNIFKELRDDLGKSVPISGNLEHWAKQGVLLLNSTLTVREGQPGSHQNLGWEQLTDFIVRTISEKRRDVVFILWGAFAKEKKKLIDVKKHYIIESAHPSPFSVYRGFYGSKPFSKTNNFLASLQIEVINW